MACGKHWPSIRLVRVLCCDRRRLDDTLNMLTQCMCVFLGEIVVVD